MKFERYIDDNLEYAILLSFLFEGVYDPSIFKAIFLAGGPGSGKSFIGEQATGTSKSGKKNFKVPLTGPLGLKIVNSDILFEKMAKQAGISLKDMSFDGPDAKVRNAIRDRAKNLTNKQLNRYVNGRLGVVIDGTGRRYEKTEKQRTMLEKIGYDTYMIFVNTTLDVSLQRNADRDRNVDEKFVILSWKAVQKNLGKFQGLFGASNFKIVDNNVFVDDLTIFNKVFKDIMKFVKKPIKNQIAQEWIAQALEKKRR